MPNKAHPGSRSLRSYSKSLKTLGISILGSQQSLEGHSALGVQHPPQSSQPQEEQYTTDPQQATLDGTQTNPSQLMDTQRVSKHEQGKRPAPSGLIPPMKWRTHTHSHSPHSCCLLIPLESRLEDIPDHPWEDQGTSSTDSSKSPSSECPEDSSPPREQVALPAKILDTGLIFRLGHGGTYTCR